MPFHSLGLAPVPIRYRPGTRRVSGEGGPPQEGAALGAGAGVEGRWRAGRSRRWALGAGRAGSAGLELRRWRRRAEKMSRAGGPGSRRLPRSSDGASPRARGQLLCQRPAARRPCAPTGSSSHSGSARGHAVLRPSECAAPQAQHARAVRPAPVHCPVLGAQPVTTCQLRSFRIRKKPTTCPRPRERELSPGAVVGQWRGWAWLRPGCRVLAGAADCPVCPTPQPGQKRSAAPPDACGLSVVTLPPRELRPGI